MQTDNPLTDIITPRLVLRLMQPEALAACLAADFAGAGSMLDANIPGDLADSLRSLHYNQLQLDADPYYLPWSARAIILPGEQTMIGLIRFHGSPDAAYLHAYARNAVEFGYRIFANWQRQGYATEAVKAMMQYARERYNIRHFVASIAPDNVPSLQLATRLGFAKVGEAMDEEDGIEHVFIRIANGVSTPEQ